MNVSRSIVFCLFVTLGACATAVPAFGTPVAVVPPAVQSTLKQGRDLYEKAQYKQALDLWIPLAAKGVAQAQFYLGVAYYTGQGMPKDLTKSIAWFSKAADKRNADAEVALGKCYSLGEGVTKDEVQAFAWYRKAADQGDAAAQWLVGDSYQYGHGVSKDLDQAIDWYQKSASQDFDPAKVILSSVLSLRNACALLAEQGDTNPTCADYTPTVAAMRKTADIKASSNFPPVPAMRPGITSCNTRCYNGQCVRTYDSGKHVAFQAEHKFNAFNNEWEWDAGAC
jgi:uncharacterized protein